MKIYLVGFLLLMVNLVVYSQAYVQKQKVVDDNRNTTDGFAFSLDVLGDYAIVSAVGDEEDLNEMNPLDSSGSVLVYNRLPNGTWVKTQKITPADRHVESAFGVKLELYNDEAFISSPAQIYDSVSANPINGCGAVYIYKRVSGQFVETQKIVPPDRNGGEDFGTGIAVWNDWLAVGASSEELNVNGTSGPAGGAVYIYRRNNTTNKWDYVQKVEASVRRAGDLFGQDLAIHNGVMIVGARRQDYDANESNFITNAGAVYVYRLTGNTWGFEQKLSHPNRAAGDNFGFSIDVNNDRIVVGSPDKQLNTGSGAQGKVYMYLHNGTSWNLQQTLDYPNASIPFSFGLFGIATELIDNKLFVGAPGDSNPLSTGLLAAGSVFEYDFVGSNYTLVNEIVPNQRHSQAVFGVYISADDNKLMVGASGETFDENDMPPVVDTAGALYVYEQCIHSNIPQITASTAAICAGDSVQLVVNSSNALNSAKDWYWYTGIYGSGTLVDSTDTIWVSPTTTTTYSIAGEGYCVNANMSDSVGSFTVNVNALPTVTASSTPGTTVCSGQSVTLSGSGASSYVWDNSVIDATSFTPFSLGTTTYKVVGTDVNGCVDSATIDITVSNSINVGINFTGSTTICSGTSITLSGTGATSYSWSPSISDGVAFTPTVTNTYTVTGTSSGCTATADTTITVIAGPSVTPTAGVTTICQGESVSISATGADSFVWTGIGAGQSQNVSPSTTTMYYVTGTQNSTMCTDLDSIEIIVNPLPSVTALASPNDSLCLGESLTLTSGAASPVWNNGVFENIAFTPTLGSVDYVITSTDANNCSNSDTVNVKVFSLPVISATVSNQGPCSGSLVTVNGFGGVSYVWDSSGVDIGIINGVPFAPSAGSYSLSVTGTDVNGCEGTAVQAISVNESPMVSAVSSAGGNSLCEGDTVNLTATGTGQSYSWDNGVLDGVDFEPSVGTTLYTVTATSANQCTATASVSIVVDIQEDATITPVLPLCGGVPVEVLEAVTPGGQWQGVGVDANSGNFDASIAGQGVHEIIYTTSGVCNDSDTINIEVYEGLEVSVYGDSVCFGDQDGEVSVEVVNGVAPYTYLWDNDETTSSINELGEGIYSVEIRDGNNCIVNIDVDVLLTENCDYHLFLPNIFSPNGDGSNDVFYARGKGFSSLELLIYDRWGNQVFETNDKYKGWDGTVNGKNVEGGVYVYYVKVEYYDGSEEILEGNVCVAF